FCTNRSMPRIFPQQRVAPFAREKPPAVGDLCKTLRAAHIAVPCREKSGLQADGLRRRIFHESPSQYGPSNPYA
ncbi:hypothetical protein, partial [Sinorhizobium meliloti]|uniref:hypothetical protein n=1 Tax=Rhizobium meliloti TaxID=382 RepID=UPI001AEE0902